MAASAVVIRDSVISVMKRSDVQRIVVARRRVGRRGRGGGKVSENARNADDSKIPNSWNFLKCDFLFCLSFGEIIDFLCQLTYS